MKAYLPLFVCSLLGLSPCAWGNALPCTLAPVLPPLVSGADAKDGPASYLAAAEAGDAEAQCRVADCYAYGIGVEVNMETAVIWLEKAAEQGHARALFALGTCFEKGNGVNHNFEAAEKYYVKAAEKGYAPAMTNLGVFNLIGATDYSDAEAALEYFLKAAALGEPLAMSYAGRCYASEAFNRPELAREWWLKSAALGCSSAMIELGDWSDAMEHDIAEAARWYAEAEKHGDEDAAQRLVWLRARRVIPGGEAVEGEATSMEEAAELCRQAREYMYRYDGEEEVDEAKARACCLRALPLLSREARAGKAEAQYLLSECYENGYACRNAMEPAMLWLRHAARQGHVEAQKKLAWAHYNDYGVPHCRPAAIDWCLRAAEAGDAEAARELSDYTEPRRALSWSEEGSRSWNIAHREEEAQQARRALLDFLKSRGRVSAEAEKLTTLELMDICSVMVEDEDDGLALLCLARCHWYGYEVPDDDWPVSDSKKAQRLLERSAQQGCVEAMFCLGQMQEVHAGGDEDAELGASWYRRAAEKGHLAAQVQMASCCIEGRGVEQDAAEALRWCMLALKNENPLSPLNMAPPLYTEDGWERDPMAVLERIVDSEELDVENLRELAGMGLPRWQFRLAECCARGEGTDKNEAEALQWYERAAAQGLREARYALAVCCEEGRGMPEDAGRALSLYRRIVAEVAEDTDDKSAAVLSAKAELRLAACLAAGRGTQANPGEALHHYSRAVNRDSETAMPHLLAFLETGVIVPEKLAEQQRQQLLSLLVCHAEHSDPRWAGWLRQLAESGDGWAQFLLAAAYEEGDGFDKDVGQAVMWYRRALEQEYTSAAAPLANMLLQGACGEDGYAEGIALLRLVIEKEGSYARRDALKRLGQCCLEGTGLPRDERQAFQCFRRAFCEPCYTSDEEVNQALAECYDKGIGCKPNPQLAEVIRRL